MNWRKLFFGDPSLSVDEYRPQYKAIEHGYRLVCAIGDLESEVVGNIVHEVVQMLPHPQNLDLALEIRFGFEVFVPDYFFDNTLGPTGEFGGMVFEEQYSSEQPAIHCPAVEFRGSMKPESASVVFAKLAGLAKSIAIFSGVSYHQLCVDGARHELPEAESIDVFVAAKAEAA